MRVDPIALLKKAGVGVAILPAFYFCPFYALGAQTKGETVQGPSDVACILIAMRGTETSDSEKKRAFQVSLTYFLGRYQGGGSKEPLATLVRKEIERQELMAPAALNKEQAACGAMVSAAGRLMKTVGTELQKQGR